MNNWRLIDLSLSIKHTFTISFIIFFVKTFINTFLIEYMQNFSVFIDTILFCDLKIVVKCLLQEGYEFLWVRLLVFPAKPPFRGDSCPEKTQDHLDLFIESRLLTRELLYQVQRGRMTHFPVLFGGPHGKSICMDDYEKILTIASGFGITAQLPYL